MAVKSLAQSSSILQSAATNSMLAGYESNYFHHLETVRLSSTTSSISFNNLQRYSDYQHLQIRYSVKGDTNTRMYMRVNGDSGNNYSWHFIVGYGGLVSEGASSQPAIRILNNLNPGANSFAGGVIDVLDAFETNKNKVFRTFAGIPTDTAIIQLGSGVFYSLNQISSISFGSGNVGFGENNAISGSRFSLYGIKARS